MRKRISLWWSLLIMAVIATACTASVTEFTEVAPVPTPAEDAGEPPAPGPTDVSAAEPTAVPPVETTVPDEPTAAPAAPEPPTPAPGEADAPVWSSCAGGECTTVTVPLDYDVPDGPTIDVAVARAPARNAAERIGSIFVNFGGPGGESTALFPSAAALLGDIFNRFDIVVWDPRGVGRTERLACDEVLGQEFLFVEIDPRDGFDDELATQEIEFSEVAACAAASGDIVDHLGTVNVARDMEQVRLALGGEPMNYLGFSYGTQIGWVYATLFGESVRSMILDGAVPAGPISADDFVDQLTAFERTFDYFDEICDRTAECLQADEGLAEAVERVADQLQANPVALGNGEFFTHIELRAAVLFGMYQPTSVVGPLLTRWIDDASNGDVNGLVGLLRAGSSNSTPGAYQAVLCADGGAFPSSAGQIADYEATFAASETFGVLGEVVRCDLWPGEAELPPELDTSAAPTIIVIGNTFDPATPYESAVLLDQQLADSVLLTVEGGGHTAVLDDPCAGRVAVDYFNDLLVPPEGLACFTPGLFGVELGAGASGVFANTVLPGSPADRAGMQANDVIVSVNGVAMNVPSDIPAIRAGTPTEVVLRRDGGQLTLTITPAVRPWN